MNIPDCCQEEPADLQTVISVLSASRGKARILAGGTDILVEMKSDLVRPETLVSLRNVNGLTGIGEEGGELRIGALVTPNMLAGSDLVKEWLPALAEAALSMASYQIRNMATLGGNVCSAVPSADLPPPLIAAGARLLIQGPAGEKQTDLKDFFLGPRKTTLGDGDVVTHVIIPRQPSETGISYQKFKLREANALAVAASAVRLTLVDGEVKDAMVVLGAVAPVPLMAPETIDILIGNEPTDEVFDEAALKAAAESRPISDVRGSESYRRELVRVLTRRALDEALTRAKGVEA